MAKFRDSSVSVNPLLVYDGNFWHLEPRYKAIMLPVIICVCKIWSRTIRLGWLEHNILRKISGPKREEFRNRVWKYIMNFAICSVVGIATRYGLEGPGIESLWERDFPYRPDRPWGSPSFLYNGPRVFFPGVKRPGRGVDHPVPSSPEVKERVELYLYSPNGSS